MQNRPNVPSAKPDSVNDSPPGESIDSGKGRIFPCDRCGADLEFSIGQQSLQCPFCGSVKQIELPGDRPIVERDFLETVERLKRRGESRSAEVDVTADSQHAVRCNSCGAEVVFQGTLTSTHCPYCACPLQRDRVHDSKNRIPVDGVLPFIVPQNRASENLRNWVRSLWWAPNEFLQQGASGKFSGVYLPYFTYDALTFTRYAGQRGDSYFVEVGEGNNRRMERRVRWSYADGEFQEFFDDVLIIAVDKQQASLVQQLEPWPLEHLISYTPEVLAGFFSRTYDVELEDGFKLARDRVDFALGQEVRQRIGGEEQIVSSLSTNYSAITYKHLLLPVWLMAYRFRGKSFQVMINATTGEVCGERPYSWVKITFATVLAVITIVTIWLLANSSR